MIFLIVGLVALFLVNKSGINFQGSVSVDKNPVPTVVPRPVSAVATHVIHQSTGASLSQALGTANRAPGFYASGNPGTVGAPITSSSIMYAKPKWSAPPRTRTVSNPIHGNLSQNNPPAPQKTTEQTAVGVKRVSSALTNPKQSTRAFAKPEWPGAFWTRVR